MKKSFRLAIETLASDFVAPLLKGTKVAKTEFTAHKDGSCTVAVNDALKDRIKAQHGVEVIKEGVSSITFRTNAMADYAAANPPLYTDAEKAQMEADKAARKANRAQRRAPGLVLEGEEEGIEDYDEVDFDMDDQ